MLTCNLLGIEKSHVYHPQNHVNKDIGDVFLIISWGFMTVLHIKATLCTSMHADVNRLSMLGSRKIDHSYTYETKFQ